MVESGKAGNQPQETDQLESVIQVITGAFIAQTDVVNQNLSKTTIDKTKRQVQLSEDLEKELRIDLEELTAQVDQIEKKVILNINSKENSDGLLTHLQKEYDDCLKVDVARFKYLIDEDVRTWR